MALLEWSYLSRFHPSYASAGSFLESNTRDRFLLAESAIFPIMSQRCALTWYALTVTNWVTPSVTVKKKSSAVFAKRTANTPLIVNYLGGGALKKLTVVIMMLLLLPFQSLDRHSLSRSLLLMSLLPMAPLLQSLYRSLYLMFLLHSLLRSPLLMYLLHLPVFSSHHNHHRSHLLVSPYHCPRTPQISPPHSPRSLLSLHNRLSPSFRLLNRRPCLFLCPKSLLFRLASFLALLLCVIYSLSLQLIRNVLLFLIKLLLRWRFQRILALQLRCAHHRFLFVLHLLELHRNASLPC